MLSYAWANSLLYRMTGTQMPNFGQGEKAKKGEVPPPWQGVDAWVARAQARMPGWRYLER